jgi:SAM-dependent methyltransferase
VVVSSPEVVWHELECGSYRADLPLWRELAARAAAGRRRARVLDIGAGTGRVAIPLARAGHRVTALDIDARLLEALAERAAGSSIETVCADARTFELDEHDFDLCLIPMQTVQLLAGPGERVSVLERARAHLRQGGLLALAIVSEVEPFDCAAGDAGPAPESARLDGTVYLSRPTRVRVLPESILIERERLICRAGGRRAAEPLHGRDSAEQGAVRDVIELQRLDAPGLEQEAIDAGLRPEPARTLPATDDHVGSTVVMLRA